MTTAYRTTDNAYINIVIDHPAVKYNVNPAVAAIGADPVVAEYNHVLTNPIISKASDFYISVTRFDIPLNSIPIYVMNQIIPDQSNPDLTNLVIGFRNGSNFYPVYLIYLANGGFPVPSQVGQKKQLITPYYYCYSYQLLINMINNGINQAWTDSGLEAAFPDVTAPFFFLTPETGLLSLIVPKELITTPGVIRRYDMFCNDALLNYIDGFPVYFNSYNTPNGADYIFDFLVTPEKAYAIPPAVLNPANPPDYYQFVQEFSTLAIWSSVKKIVLSTNTIPINTEYIPVYGDTQSAVANSFPVLADFVPIINKGGDTKGIAYYLPTAQYHLVDLLTDGPIQSIDLRIFWQDIEGNLNPIYITQNEQINVKISFFRKSLYKHY